MTRALALMPLVACLLAGQAAADYEFTTLFTSENRIVQTALAASPDGDFVVAWCEEGVGVWTAANLDDEYQAPAFQGTGGCPGLAWTAAGFTLAWAQGDSIRLRRGDGAVWNEAGALGSGSGQSVWALRLTGAVPAVGFTMRYLAWREADGSVWFSRCESGGWLTPVQLAGFEGDFIESSPQALPVETPGGPQPRVYYLGSWEMYLFYREYDGEQWGPQVSVDDYGILGTAFDIAVGPDGLHHILSNGPQPTCPCNELNYLREIEGGGWSEPFQLANAWPQHPSLALTDDGRVHAFFYESYWWDLEYMGEANRYLVKEGDSWLDESVQVGFPTAGYFTRCAIDPRGEMIFVYAQGHLAEPRLTVALNRGGSGAPAPPAGVPSLAAWPNPFNPATTLLVSLPAPGPARLEILDPRGRRVALLLDGEQPGGERAVRWDGRDRAGNALPSGLYLARLSAGDRSAGTRLVLLK